MLLLILSKLLNPERLNFSCSVHSLPYFWHREGKAAHKKKRCTWGCPWIFGSFLQLLILEGSLPKPRGQRAGGRRPAGAVPLAPVGATHTPTPNPATRPPWAPAPPSGVRLLCAKDRRWAGLITGWKKPSPSGTDDCMEGHPPQLHQCLSPSAHGDGHP